MLCAIDHRGFETCSLSPEDKNQSFVLLVQYIDHLIGKAFPALSSVRVGLTVANAEHGIEQQDSLFGPVAEVPMSRGRELQIGV